MSVAIWVKRSFLDFIISLVEEIEKEIFYNDEHLVALNQLLEDIKDEIELSDRSHIN